MSFKRSSGILMHISSLPSKYGIGDFGIEAYSFVDFLKKSGQTYWQILPLGSTGYGDSPYQSFSAFDGNTDLIDLDQLISAGYIKEKEIEACDFGSNSKVVDYEKVTKYKMDLLKKAFKRVDKYLLEEIEKFRKENSEWIEDYGLFMSLKEYNSLKPWKDWEDGIRLREEKSLTKYRKKFKNDILFWIFTQYIFFTQWAKLKEYANSNGVRIIGDIPIYVAEDSADTWANSEIFYLDENRIPVEIAGCPPDAFTDTGQLWGNPIYRWDVLEERDFDWWIARIKSNLKLYDVLRIDHFRGFEAYWQVPYGSETAENGKWIKGPGIKIFDAIEKALGEVEIIAEDLGYLTEGVHKLRKETGFPGMKVLQFAFDAREESDYLPQNYEKHCIVYTGTHDNDTIVGWLETTGQKSDVDHAIDYLKLTEEEGYHWGFIRGAWSSVGELSIAQMQDFLGLGNESRMNVPSTIGGNWIWRCLKEDLNNDLAKKIYNITKLYGRLGTKC